MSLDSSIPELVLAAWARTQKTPTYLGWVSVSKMAGGVVVQLLKEQPGSPLAFALDGIAEEAHRRALAMEPVRCEERWLA